MLNQIKNQSSNKSSMLLAVSACLAFQAFIFVPASVYLSNVDEMNISINTLLKLCLIPALLLLLVSLGIGSLLSNKKKQRYTVIIAILSILVWLQSNAMLWDYGVLNGVAIDWNENRSHGYLDLSIWITALISSVIWFEKIGNNIIRIALLLLAMQTIAINVLIFQQRENLQQQPSQVSENQLQQLYQFSNTKNILHILIDGFQSDVFQDLIQHPDLGKYYQEKFTDFVYYPETLTAFPYTRFAVPAFLSGEMYSNEMPQDDFVDAIMAGKNIFNAAASNGFELDLGVEGPYLEKRYAHARYKNLYNFDSINSTPEEIAKLLDLALFRMMPHFLKPLIYNNQEWLIAPFFAGKPGMQFNYFKNTLFLNNFTHHMNVSRDKPVYKYLHIMNTHNPMMVNERCEYSGEILPTTRTTLTIQSKCTLDTLVALFAKMKTLGIYDNTLIIMHSDHGGWVPNHRNGSRVVFPGGQTAPDWVASLASPLLSIKLPNELPNNSQPLTTSTVLVSLRDIPDTISDIMQWHVSFGQESILKIPNDSLRERRFRFYGWRDDEWTAEYAQPIQEFIIKGSHYETTWQAGELFLPKNTHHSNQTL